ncbi:RING/U-box superfamily protein [Striga hermonthica]|uniref:RING-type E3 ubiquitin transferase n=1 Tax=Striga hermonthica TaxID=68872 RepID=A0A9N7RNH3_STRHE|nr:RING/U-box superfamily protein [Striga hermonthica]
MMLRKGQNTSNGSDKEARFCNRIGCNGRVKYAGLNPRIGSSEKAKLSTKPSFPSSSGDGMGVSKSKSLLLDSKRKTFSRSEVNPSGSSGQSGESEHSSSSKNVSRHHCFASKNESSGEIRPRKVFHHKNEPNNQHTTRLAISVPFNSKSSGIRTLYNSNKSSNITSNNDDNSSSSINGSSSKKVMKNKNIDAESSFSRRGRENGRLYPSAGGISISGSGSSNSASGDSQSATRRAVNVNSGRPRLSSSSSYQQNGRNHNTSLSIGGPRFYGTRPSTGSSSYSFSGVNSGNQSFTMGDLDFTHLMNHTQYSMDGIAEVLLAIDRIEHDEELTHEQFFSLETSLFLSGLNLYDRHRDMRLDIDNMSYEELLALGERMGTVSTALSDEALSECIKTSTYNAGPHGVRLIESVKDEDDLKCSICQEEYAVGDEIGKLVVCLHDYHLTCINQWLRLKNWCPVCKAPAAKKE